MINRALGLTLKSSFFLFGARGTGKTLLLKARFAKSATHFIDLLDPERYASLSLRPSALEDELKKLPKSVKTIVIDEVQKIPVLLDIVHREISRGRFRFALTGSNARKLRRGGANLLAGRAFVYHLFPLTHRELGDQFDLEQALSWGTLPGLLTLKTDEDKSLFLKGYAHTYLQEEIIQEQVLRNLLPFRRFLAVAAQMNGQTLNYKKIADEIGSTTPSVQSYFQILEDTLVGRIVEPFHESIRKRQRANPKFYFFDPGVLRALKNTLTVPVVPQSFEFGFVFESFVINEIHRLQEYARKDFQLSYLRTKDDVEIDLIIERPGRKRALIEIKSTKNVTPRDVRSLKHIQSDFSNSEAFCFSLDPIPKIIEGVSCLPWTQGLIELGI